MGFAWDLGIGIWNFCKVDDPQIEPENEKGPVPPVVRLEGTNVEAGKKFISESELAVIAADDLADAAQKVVAAAKKE